MLFPKEATEAVAKNAVVEAAKRLTRERYLGSVTVAVLKDSVKIMGGDRVWDIPAETYTGALSALSEENMRGGRWSTLLEGAKGWLAAWMADKAGAECPDTVDIALLSL